MEAVLSRLQILTSEELREEMTKAGLKCGPVTATTRGIFEKKLARTILETQAGAGEGGVDSSSPEVGAGDQRSSTDSTDSPAAQPEAKWQEEAGDHVRTLDRTSEEASPQASPGSPSLFYGVSPPPDDPSFQDGYIHVYTDRMKALGAVMKMKGARFKAFSSREEAENFAKGLSDNSLLPHRPSGDKSQPTSPAEKSVNLEMANLEKPNEFKSPRTQDLTAKLRRAVENGDEEDFRKLVWENPRYLIGSGDNPTIVQEGCRYNVLHVAAKENQAAMVRLILETLENPEFMRLMYPDDQEDMLWQRIDYVVDLYLNTPDKGSNETPLHFACKFGCPEVVNVLCSHPATDKNCRNKYGQSPSTVICERKKKSKEVKKKIIEYMEDRCFVPLLRATDNTLHPVIGVPWAPGSPKYDDLALSPSAGDNPRNPEMTLRAFVGPLNPLKADEFHKLWKTPPRDRARYYHHILKSDPDRGTERVGRELAHEREYPWAEYWDFLNCFTDLATEDGLGMLEEYLNNAIHLKTVTKNSWISVKSPDSPTLLEKTPTSVSGKFSDDHLHSSSETSLDPSTFDSSAEENGPGSVHKRSTVCDLLGEFERVSVDRVSGISAGNSEDSGLGFFALSGSGGADGLVLGNTSSLRRLERNQTKEDDSSSEEYYTADEESEDVCRLDDILVRRGRRSSGSSISSYKSTGSLSEDRGHTLGQNIFLAGKSPSKLDHAVLLAVTGVDIDDQQYPSIVKWKNTVLSYPEAQRERWPTVTVMNRLMENQTSTPCRLTRSWMTGSPSFLRLKKFVPVQENHYSKLST